MIAIVRAKTSEEAESTVRSIARTDLVRDVILVLSTESTGSINLCGGCTVTVVSVPSFGWSRSINAGLDALKGSGTELVMIVSTTVAVHTEDVRALTIAARRENAACGYALFEDRNEPSYLIPRNTYIVWNKAVLDQLGPFDESLDASTGMEDYEMVQRCFDKLGMLPFLGPRNVTLEIPKPETFDQKLERELRGMRCIEQRYDPSAVGALRQHLVRQFEIESR